MKKIIVLFLSLTIMASLAGAVTLMCSNFGSSAAFPSGVGTRVDVCPAFSAPGGNVITSVTVTVFGDYTFGASGSNTVHFTFGSSAGGGSGPFDVPAGLTGWSPVGPILGDVSGGTSSSTSTTLGMTSGLGLPTVSVGSFSVGITSSVTLGTIFGAASAGVQIDYTYAPPQQGVPEPATLGIMGASLLGLGLLARKKK